MLKQTSLAALAAIFIVGGNVVANAESGAGLPPSSENDAAALQANYAAKYGNPTYAAGGYAYGYAKPAGTHHRNRVKIRHYNR